MIEVKDNLRLKDYTLPTGERTCIMGVLNVTPDSFSDGGRYLDPRLACEKAMQMAEAGADIIDIGGESSRPGAKAITPDEELARIMPAIRAIRKKVDIPLSADTYKSKVAREALSEGVSIINDITALGGDRLMARTIAEFDAGVILMHMKGDPRTMQDSPRYDDVMGEIFSYLSGAISAATDAGIDPGRIIIDPGIGFGKKLEHNLEILRNLSRLEQLGKPILVGTSRKAFIGELTGRPVDNRAFGTAASVAAAVMNGAGIVRVHDVDSMMDVMRVTSAIRGK